MKKGNHGKGKLQSTNIHSMKSPQKKFGLVLNLEHPATCISTSLLPRVQSIAIQSYIFKGP